MMTCNFHKILIEVIVETLLMLQCLMSVDKCVYGVLVVVSNDVNK